MMTDEDAIARASNAGFRIYGEPWRWYWASKFWVDRGGRFRHCGGSVGRHLPGVSGSES